MKIHTHRIIGTAAMILLSSAAQSDGTPHLTITSLPVTVEIETRNGSREFIELPTLRYSLDVQQRCPTDMNPVNLSVSVADTRRTVSADGLASTNSLTMQLSIPGEQIAPVAIAGFCATSDENADLTDTHPSDILSISDILSLQAALSCSSETGSQVVYASLALDVELRCDPTNTTEPSENQ